MKARYKLLLGTFTFSLLFYFLANLFVGPINNAPAEDIQDAIGQIISIYLYFSLYLLVPPIFLLVFLYSKWKKKQELALGSLLSLAFSLIAIAIFYYRHYAIL